MKKNIVFWLSYIAILIFLYIMSATELIIKEKKTEIYRISMISDESFSKFNKNIKKGIDAATYEKNVDLNFIVLDEDSTIAEETKKIEEEIENGAKAVILQTRWQDRSIERIRRKYQSFPILTVGDRGELYDVSSVSPNYEKAEELIVNRLKNISTYSKLYLVSGKKIRLIEIERLRIELTERLKKQGYEVEFIEIEEPKEFIKYGETSSFIFLDKYIATEIMKYLDEHRLKVKTNLFVIGQTNYLIKKLEAKNIRALIIWDEYELGYIAIEEIVDIIDRKLDTINEKIKVYYITEEELKNEMFIKILYPINT